MTQEKELQLLEDIKRFEAEGDRFFLVSIAMFVVVISVCCVLNALF